MSLPARLRTTRTGSTLPEFGIWADTGLRPAGLNRTRAQLAIVAGLAMGHPLHRQGSRGALEDLAAKPTDPVPAAASARRARRARNPLLRSPAQQRFSPGCQRRIGGPQHGHLYGDARTSHPQERAVSQRHRGFGPAGHVFHGGIAVSSDDDAAKWSGWWWTANADGAARRARRKPRPGVHTGRTWRTVMPSRLMTDLQLHLPFPALLRAIRGGV
ncbi:hypothetical protein I553_3849 [Mycobacterium xenopi 4042]|uniref:Uncharacterized protein n=1 Tax=Mycobacterium xenopi 4042 TaxID=1299334 RepID=X8APU3_MYCXE|nr:hypothetical protein I553_3849 [Mycobacterium xenopi 4042]